MAHAALTTVPLALLVLSACRPAAAQPPFASPLPPGSVLVECEDLPRSSWHRYAAPEARGGAKALANRADWVAEGSVELPAGRYAVWARSGDDGNYPDCYQYNVTIDGRTCRMAVTEPLGRTWVWERWGDVDGGTHAVRLDGAHSFASKADCILFTPDLSYRPSGRPLVSVEAMVIESLPRLGGEAHRRFTPREPVGEQVVRTVLRDGMKVVWKAK